MTEIDPPADDPFERPVPHAAEPARVPPVIEHQPVVEAPVIERRGGTPFAVTLLLFAVLAGGIYYAWKTPFPGIFGPAPQAASSPATDQLKADLEAQIQAGSQASSQAAAQSASQAIAPLHDQIAALAARVDRLEKTPSPSPDGSAVVAPVGSGPTPATADSVSALDARLGLLSAKVDALSAHPDAAPSSAPAAGGPAPASADSVTTLDARVEQLSAKVDALSAHPEPAPAPPPQDNTAAEAASQAAASAQAQVAALGSKLDQANDAQKALAQTADRQKTTIDALTERLTKLEQGTGRIESEADMAAKAARADALQAALTAGKPLGDISNAPAALARFATAAPPTDASLRAAFPQVAAQARAVSRAAPADQSFWSRALARMQQIVVVRRGDQVIVGDPAAGVLARAADDVNRDDLSAAVKSLAALQGPAAQAVAGWVGQVQSLLDARAALAAMAATH